MKSIYDKVKRFGSPVKTLQSNNSNTDSNTYSNTNRQNIREKIREKISNDNEEDNENNRYNKYETKYMLESTPHKTIFSHIYENEHLGCDGSIYYKGSCGLGSSYDYNKDDFVPFLRNFIMENQIKSVVDLGCGNLGYDKKLYGEVGVKAFYGYDVYNPVQEHNRRFSNHKKYHFFSMDFLLHKEELVPADLCIIKDVLQHWILTDIYTLLDHLIDSKLYKYIMIINCCDQKNDILVDSNDFKTGSWRKLSSKFLPLKKYNPKPIFYYKTKEVSIIQCYLFDNKSRSRTPSPAKIPVVDKEIYNALYSKQRK